MPGAEAISTATLRRAAGAAALVCLLALLLGAGSARAARSHPAVTSTFGPDGTATTEFEGLGAVAIDQTNQHVFTYENPEGHIRGFAINSAASRTPLGGPYPLTTEYPNDASLAAGNGPHNLFASPGPFQIFGFTENGEAASTRFPLTLERSYICDLATDSKGDVWVAIYEPNEIKEFSPTGVEMRTLHIGGGEYAEPICAIDFDRSTDDLFASKESGPVRRFTAASEYTRSVEVLPQGTSSLSVDASAGIVYALVNGGQKILAVRESGAPVEEINNPKQGYSFRDIAVDEADDSIYATEYNQVDVFAAGPVVADVTTGPVSGATETSATVTGTVDPAGGPEITTCKFEYGESAEYLSGSVPCDQGNTIPAATTVTATLPNLAAGRTYHYRIFVETANGKSVGADRTATVAGPPAIEGLFSSNVTESSADLSARINPGGAETTYRFEYGTTVAYGNEAPVGGASAGAGQDSQTVSVHLAGIGSGTYHFRVVASNTYGTVVSSDQTFNFYPPECPNAHLRQQTGGSYLPDCRAYELVSPGDANGVVMFPEAAPDAPYATNPTRYPFGAALGVIPGTEATNATGVDTYIATRTDTGWVTKYSGLRGSEVLGTTSPIGNLGFDKILDFRADENFGGVPQPRDEMPYVWDSVGNFLERWPVGASSNTPGASASHGAYQPSPDFSHFAFSSAEVAFTQNGRVEVPGSAYDYDVANHTTTLISLLPDGKPIPQNPTSFSPYEFILFPGNNLFTNPSTGKPDRAEAVQDHPGVSTDGSHILMSTTEGGYSTGLVKLYMRVNDAVTYLVSKNHAVSYVGMTSDGTRVFFTSPEQLVAEDTDSSVDLYMWSEATDSLTLISKGPGVGNSDACNASWTTKCGASAVSRGRPTDYPIATDSGDIYFYSPEQLAGPEKGIPDKRNLYVYRNGSVHFVTTLGSPEAEAASRIQVSPNGLHMAFVTSSRLGAYDNAGRSEMYSYDPEAGKLTCVSCLPDGETPTDDVEASLDGLFMSNDGRTFFYTSDPLVPRDTDGIHDVYEYTEGQAQLISSGTGAADKTQRSGNSRPGGLEGVSADGVNVYFLTYETLVPQDENGQFLKFYDARVNGGFPYTPPPADCEAADECHGEGSAAPAPAQIVSENGLGNGGNFAHKHKKKKKKHGKKKHGAHSSRHHNGKKAAQGRSDARRGR
jgi:hypothetical protein